MPTQIAIALYPDLTLLDVIGPYQVLTLVPDVEVVVCAAERGRLSDDNGLVHLDVEHTFDDVPSPDVLLVGGGFGTRALMRPGTPIVEWIRAADATTTWTTSVCTGSLLLGAAGLLEGRRATTHWHYAELLEGFGATYAEDRIVADGKYLTGAGVSAGIDLALTLTATLAGDDIARAVQLGIEYDPQPPFDAGSPAKAGPELVELVGAVSDMAEAQRTA
ncbi:DJ-1/PfpI family protein [Dermatobacter hominis]|uniref:DJ-1/PfpI family protein n=1 Tax=Dermatobacter hominis TaxID=2884263 RepID=UPI001D10477E|nr:DJ-1/PfpI family protein [Dermatobacter hominis]UDY35998.1 DJ-1/PfpI family protein [Dermatobacter hominis]